MKSAITDFVKDRWPLYLGYGLLRRIVQGKKLMRRPSDQATFQSYESELAKWQWLRQIVLDAEERRLRRLVSENYGFVIPQGPFEGMKYQSCQREFSAAKRLGFYEAELHRYVDQIVARGYRRIVNIGCSFGYYAVGLAMRMEDCEVHAFDIDARARQRCRQLAEENGVAGRVIIGERFDAEMFDRFTDQPTLILCDIEGAETELLDPQRTQALHRFDIVVELHDVFDPAISVDLPNRFRSTHDVELVPEGKHELLEMPEMFRGMGALERLVACHGGQRWGGTPWAFMSSHTCNLKAAG